VETASLAGLKAGEIGPVDNENQALVPFLSFAMPFLLRTGEDYPHRPLMDWYIRSFSSNPTSLPQSL
jgi:hypothetical protein